MVGVGCIFNIRTMTWAIDPSVKYGLTGGISFCNIFRGTFIRDSGSTHAIEWILPIGVGVTEEGPIVHILTMGLSHASKGWIPLKSRKTF